MKKILLASMICAASISMSMSVFAADPDAATILKDAKIKAEADYKIASAKCTSMIDNAKDVCVAEAKSARVHTEENAQANFHNTLSARTSAIKKIADADYEVDKAKCMAMVGNEKDVCIKKAKSSKVAAVATAKADKKVSEARTDEAEDKKNAEYKVAIEKCDAMTGTAKDTCVSSAKKKFGK
jgi:antitoxin component HigA of HigAB toxin-antitoxin module